MERRKRRKKEKKKKKKINCALSLYKLQNSKGLSSLPVVWSIIF
jgi:hypothetical protein